MKTIVKLTSNNQKVNLQKYIDFHRIKVAKLLYKPSVAANTHEVLLLKLNGYNDGIYSNNNSNYFFSLPILGEIPLSYINNDPTFDFCNPLMRNEIQITISIYEGDTMVTDAYLSTNPMIVELIFE
jgi:hypothetical protein